MPGTRKRLFAAALALFAVCLVLAGPAAAEGIDIDGSNVRGLGTNAQYYYTTAEVGFLTLNGGTWDYINVTGLSDLIIWINGTNKIEDGNTAIKVRDDGTYYTHYGVYANVSDLTIQNKPDCQGSLNVNVISIHNTTGIYSVQNLAINSGTVIVNVTSSGIDWVTGIDANTLQIAGGSVTANVVSSGGGDAYAIYADDDLSIFGGTVTANATSSGDGDAYGICAYWEALLISGGTVTTEASSSSDAYGIYAGDGLLISSGDVVVDANGSIALGISSDCDLTIKNDTTVTANVTASKLAVGIRADDWIDITDGTVNVVIIADNGGYAYGICVGFVESGSNEEPFIPMNNYGQITINGGSVETTTKNGEVAFGILAADITISGGTVEATSTASITATSISATDLRISGGNVLTRAAGNHAASIFATDFTISGGSVSAEARGYEAAGILVGNDLTIKNSIKQIIAKGMTQAISAGELNAPYPVIKASTDYDGTNLQVVSAYAVSKESSPYKYVLIVPGSSSGGSTDTGSGNYAEYPRQADGTAGEIDFGTSKEVKAVDLPEGVTGEVRLIVESTVKGPEGKDVRNVFEINIPNYPAGKPAVIKFELTLEEIQAKGFTGADICLYHYDTETGVWTKLPTTYRVADGKVFFESVTTAFSPFAVVYEIGAATPAESDEPVVPDTPVTPDADDSEVLPPIDTPVVPETPETPAPVFAVLAGLGAALVLRRK